MLHDKMQIKEGGYIMKKSTSSGILGLRIAICLMLVMIGVFFIGSDAVSARKSKKEAQCSIQSVTLEIDGETYIFDGGIADIPVPKNTGWKDFFAKGNIKVVDYTILADENCTHEGGHDTVGIYLDMDDGRADLLEYSKGDDSYVYGEIEDSDWELIEDWSSIGMSVHLKDSDGAVISICFGKEYSIEYTGIEDATIVNAEQLPSTYVYGQSDGYLPVLEKDGYIFTGWSCDDNGPYISFFLDWLDGDVTISANWQEGERTELSLENGTVIEFDDYYQYYGYDITDVYDSTIVSMDGEELTYREDYLVSGKNLKYAGTPESENPPTVIITGIGEYKGTLEQTFTIHKAYARCSNDEVSVVKGQSLSTIDLSQFVFLDVYGDPMNGTLEWANLDDDQTPIEEIEVEEGFYALKFTPEDTDNYQETYQEVWVAVKNSITDWTVEYDDVYTYSGNEIQPSIKVMKGDDILEEGEHYEVQYINNVNVASKDAKNAPTIVIQGINEYMGSQTFTFTIEKATPTIQTNPTAAKVQEGDALSHSALTGGVVLGVDGKALEGTFSWKDANAVPTVADSGVAKYTVVFTPKDTKNYNTVEVKVAVVVEAKQNTEKPGSNETDTQKPDSNETDTQNPSSTETGTENATVQLKVGDKIVDSKTNATYKVTVYKKGVIEVAYVAPIKKTKNVTIPATITLKDKTTAKVTSIAASAFKNNTTIQKVTIGKNVKTIGKNAFANCKNLKSVVMGSKVTTINEKAFYKCTKLSTIAITKTVKTIGNSAFYGCSNLEKVTGIQNVTSIGNSAFANCKNLKSIAMGSKVTTIGEKAFYKCTKLSKIVIPKTVKSIGKSAFYGCKNLKTITIKTTKLTTKNVKAKAFDGIYSKAKIDVPNSKKNAYKKLLIARGVSKKATVK